MIDFLTAMAQFALQATIILVCILIAVAFIASLISKNKGSSDLKIKSFNKKVKSHRGALQKKILDKKSMKALVKKEKLADKNSEKKKNLFVLDFDGDIKASEVEQLRQEITALLQVAKDEDEVVIKLESPGGMVHGYGLAASQLQRLKDKNLKLTVCVDKIAASGGYMMASIADTIVAAPFAILGSIGVVASMPNFHRVLDKAHVDYLEITAGEYKRTLTPLGEVTQPKMDKFKEQIEEVHELFKSHVIKFRPKVDIDTVGTGEYWYGSQALDLKLIDQLGTSDEYLVSKLDDYKITEISFEAKKSLKEKLGENLSFQIEALALKAYQSLWNSRYN